MLDEAEAAGEVERAILRGAMRATLVLLKRDPEGTNWTREGGPLTFDDGPDQSGEEKARAYGEEWVGKDPEHRQYSIIPESFEPVRSSGEKR